MSFLLAVDFDFDFLDLIGGIVIAVFIDSTEISYLHWCSAECRIEVWFKVLEWFK
jgi:hypothetical protein